MAKKYDFTAYKVKTDADKASPILEHDYKPVKDDEDIVVRCRHFKAGQKMQYASFTRDGSASFDYRGIFLNQVDSIRGLVLTVTDAKTNAEKDIEVKDAEITDVEQYNKANGRMWKLYSLWYVASGVAEVWNEILAIVLLLAGCSIGLVFLVWSYRRIYNRYKAE